MLVICRRKGRARYGAARLSASRRSASGHAFAIVSRIGRCSLRLLARILCASRQRRAVQIGHTPARTGDDQHPGCDVPRPQPNSHNASTRPHAT